MINSVKFVKKINALIKINWLYYLELIALFLKNIRASFNNSNNLLLKINTQVNPSLMLLRIFSN